jgi:hypothetical protein
LSCYRPGSNASVSPASSTIAAASRATARKESAWSERRRVMTATATAPRASRAPHRLEMREVPRGHFAERFAGAKYQRRLRGVAGEKIDT